MPPNILQQTLKQQLASGWESLIPKHHNCVLSVSFTAAEAEGRFIVIGG